MSSRVINPLNNVLFGSDLWRTALEKYGTATQLSVVLFDAERRKAFGPVRLTPLFQLFDEVGYDPGIFDECARRCMAQTDKQPAVLVSQYQGLAAVGASLKLQGDVVGAAVGGYAFASFSQTSEIQRLARQSGVAVDRLWSLARTQRPVSQQQLIVSGELLQVLGDALLRENYRTRQYEQAEQRQQLLTNELAHRDKNLLAVIQTIISRSLSGGKSLAESREALMQRIQALARSQSVLVNGGFQGVRLEEIIRLEFEAFSDRVKAFGPDVMLNPKSAQTMALLAHELATNATKYGALSRPGGWVAINWSTQGKGTETRLTFRWQERDGPPVAPPTRQGFGRVLIEKAVAQDFGAKPKISYASEGFSYEIDAPLSALGADAVGAAVVNG